MFINDLELRNGKNDVVVVGAISEYDIRVIDCTRQCVIDGEDRTVNSAWIGGNIVVNSNGADIKMSFRYLDTIRHKKNGELNKSFTSLLTAFGYECKFDEDSKKLVYTKLDRGLTPKVEGKITIDGNVEIVRGGTPTRVKVTSKLGIAEGLNKDQSDLVFYNELPVSYISTTNVSDEDSAIFNIEGVVKSVVNEIGVNGSDTGRYLVEFVSPNFFGVDVFNFVIQDKWTNIIDGEEVEFSKEEFYGTNDSFCNIGDSCALSGEIKATTFGNVETTNTTAKKSFGGGVKNIKSGFTRIEWVIVGGESVDEEFDNELIKLALEEREVRLEKTYQEKLEYAKNNNAKKDAPKSDAPKAGSPLVVALLRQQIHLEMVELNVIHSHN